MGFVLTAIVSVLGFLVRNAFDSVGKGLDLLGKKLDDMSASIAKGDGDRRVLEARLISLEHRLDKLERECSEGRA